MIELPLTTIYWGLLRGMGPALYNRLETVPKLTGLLAKTRLLERIPLTPEGTNVKEAHRAVDIALDDKLPVIVLSFHSPSLVPGNTPYVRNDRDLDRLFDWWRQVYAYLEKRGVQPTSVAQILAQCAKDATAEHQSPAKSHQTA